MIQILLDSCCQRQKSESVDFDLSVHPSIHQERFFLLRNRDKIWRKNRPHGAPELYCFWPFPSLPEKSPQIGGWIFKKLISFYPIALSSWNFHHMVDKTCVNYGLIPPRTSHPNWRVFIKINHIFLPNSAINLKFSSKMNDEFSALKSSARL